MVEKVNPSVNRPASSFKTAGAIAYGGSGKGFVSPSSEPTEISVQDSELDETLLNAFAETSSGTSLDVTIDGGEAFVFGSWLAIDSSTTVSLEASTAGQTVYVGWNKNGTDDVIIGLPADFDDASGTADQKIELYSFDTDSSGVVGVTDLRSFDQIDASSIEQGSGSGLDADTLDGSELSDIDSTYVNESGDTMSGPLTIGGDLTATDAETIWDESAGYIPQGRLENDSLTVAGNSVSLGSSTAIAHAELSAINSDDHHTRYSDEEAQDAIAGDFLTAGNALTKEYLDNSNSLTLDVAADSIQETELDKSIAPTWSGEHTFSGGITGLPEPIQDTDAARKVYVDSIAEGLDIKESVRVCTETNIDLTSSTDPNPVDGITLSDGNRVLLKNQTDGTENGIYVASTATDPTTWTRSDDADEDTEVNSGLFVFVEEGTTHANQGFVLSTNDPITLGTTGLTFTQFSGAESFTAGAGIDQTDNTISHSDTSTQSNITSASGSAIVDLTFDDFGHVTGATTDSFDGRYVSESGDTMGGALSMGSNTITDIRGAGLDAVVSGTQYTIEKNGTDGSGIINLKTE